jgi:large repetitive protein
MRLGLLGEEDETCIEIWFWTTHIERMFAVYTIKIDLKIVALFLCLLVGLAGTTSADSLVTLTDENASLDFDLGATGAGMTAWTVDGVNRLTEQSFWYRVGNTAQQKVNALTLSGYTISDENGLTVNYADPSNRFTLQLTYLLTGSDLGSGSSIIGENIRVKNSSKTQALDFHLYQYVDVNLLGPTDPVDSDLTLAGAPSVNKATQTNGTQNLSETIATPAPTRYEAGTAASLHSELASGSVYNLNGNSSASDANLAWAFQWDTSISANGTLMISKSMQLTVVPEPSMLTMLVAGSLVTLAGCLRRRA